MNRDSFERWMHDAGFHFQHLAFDGVDNTAVLSVNRPEMKQEETCLFHHSVASGDDYLQRLHAFVSRAADSRTPAPVVRFADGEYAFYAMSLHCNGLYRQAESAEAIRAALPRHARALAYLSANGMLAPLIFPGNIAAAKPPWYRLFKRRPSPSWALSFMDFLKDSQVALDPGNYLPFYTVYAYLTSQRFLKWVDSRNLCIIGSEYHSRACERWFAVAGSRPNLSFTKVPEAYVATRWEAFRSDVLGALPKEADLCLVGAGIGSLLVCTDVARRAACPVIDAGHVMNVMNGRRDKSNGPRLYAREG